jgi:uncharacterized protein (TIGR02246 family)
MRSCFTLALLCLAVSGPALADDNPSATPSTTSGRPEDEAAIRAANEAFVRAFNAGDTRAVAGWFAADAQLIDAGGDELRGSRSILELFGTLFEMNPGAKLEIDVDSIRFLGPDVAVETGRTRLSRSRGGDPESDRFLVILVKRDGQWRPSLAQEVPARASNHRERLEDLAWMVGEWVEKEPALDVLATCDWSTDRNFLVRMYTVRLPGRPPLSGTQRIGWDAASNKLRSWVFDTDGGFSEGVWSLEGGRWVIRETGVLGDGRKVSATQVFNPVGPNEVRWKSTERLVGGKPAPDLGEIIMVRKTTAVR